MLNKNQNGFSTLFAILTGFLLLVAISLGVFSAWAYSNYQHQKNDTDEIVAEAVAVAEQEQATELQAEFAEEQKNPYKNYTSPSSLGSVKIVYPKTWGAYVVEKEDGSVKLDGYFHPNYVPSDDSNVLYAVRLELDNNNYTKELESYQKKVEKGEITAKAVTVSETNGTRYDGQIEKDIVGALVLLPLRDRTLKIWTESNDFMADYNRVIEELTYSP